MLRILPERRDFEEVKRAEFDVPSKLARFTDRCVDLSQKFVGSDGNQPVKKGEGDYADWEFITQGFIDDIGNFLLLRDTDNIGASNRPLAEKMTQYYSEIDGFASIYPNRYFTAEYGNVDRGSLDKLREQHDGGDISNVDADVVAYFNSFWTYETLQDRRIELLLDILPTLGFYSFEDEFGIESDQEEVRQEIREKTDQEFEKRLSVRSL
jgi:hypothetical protein